MGVMAGTLDLIQRGYLGTDIRDGVLYFDPRLHGTAGRLVVPHAVPRDAARGGARRRQADGRGAERRLQPADHGSASATTSASSAPASGARSRSASRARSGAGVSTRIRRRDLRRRRGARRLAARAAWREALQELMESELERHPPETTLVAGALHAAGLPAGHVRQAAHERRARGARATSGCRTPSAGRRGVRRAQAEDGHGADRGRRVHGFPDALRFVLAVADLGIRRPRRRRRRTRPVPAPDPARHVRRDRDASHTMRAVGAPS